jgi:hypothetical protein
VWCACSRCVLPLRRGGASLRKCVSVYPESLECCDRLLPYAFVLCVHGEEQGTSSGARHEGGGHDRIQ